MDEEALKDAFSNHEDDEQEEQTSQDEEQDEQQEEIQLTATEQEAFAGGWTNKDDFTSKGGDPERWKTAHEYISFGNIKKQLDSTKSQMDQMKRSFDDRLDGVNKIHHAQMEAKIKSLKSQQRQAVDEADTEKYDRAQAEIENIETAAKTETETETSTQTKDPAITAWEAKNSWINDTNDHRSQMAIGLFNGYTSSNKNATVQQALDYVDQHMSLNKTSTNPRRDAPTSSERSTQTNKSRGRQLTMSDLTQEEKSLWNNAGFDLWGNDKKAFLQSVKDVRGK